MRCQHRNLRWRKKILTVAHFHSLAFSTPQFEVARLEGSGILAFSTPRFEVAQGAGQCKGALRLYSLLKGQGLRRVCPVGGGEHTGLWVHLSKTLGTLGHALAADRAFGILVLL